MEMLCVRDGGASGLVAIIGREGTRYLRPVLHRGAWALVRDDGLPLTFLHVTTDCLP